MNQDQVKGRAKQVKGKVKEGTGKALGDDQLQARGRVEQGVGKAQSAVGRGKEKLKNAIDKA